MTDLTISFSSLSQQQKGAVIALASEGPLLSGIAENINEQSDGLLDYAAKSARYKGGVKKTLHVTMPKASGFETITLLGLGKIEEMSKDLVWRDLGGVAAASISAQDAVSVVLEAPENTGISGEDAAEFALGALLRAYAFDRYKTQKGDDKEDRPKDVAMVIQVADVKAARKAFTAAKAQVEGVLLARDLVNEPANVLGPKEFSDRAASLADLGVEVEVLGEKELTKLKMKALLGVAQGSERPAKVVVMKWMKAGKKKPVVFAGKGVVFDSGGISIKPSGGMEDMKGDMGGAAAVTGLMRTLAERKAKTNVIGIIGLVENMPDGAAQRPGDIVTSMSGQTIEIINTDAEGRLVLADILHYACKTFKPECIIDLATLTGACIIALGHDYAGLFSNNDALAGELYEAGITTGDKVWRLPLGKAYDTLIDSKFADMKNTGGRWAGAITAAQFLQRFVGETKWAHLDIAGTAMDSPKNDVNQSWASGFGVRILDQFIASHYEKE